MKLKLRSLLFSTFVLLLFSAEQNFVSAQAQLVFGATPTYMRMSGGSIYMVLGNSASSAIVHTGTGGIISEGEFNYVKWNVGSTTGANYKIPWRDETAPATEDVSVKFDVTAGGTATGFFLASTYDGVTDNLTYKPTPVTNMTSTTPPNVNASQWVVDRFWSLIDAASYPAKPALANLIFTYPENEWNLNTGPITEANLGAQRWKTTDWDGIAFPPQGTDVSASNTVSLAAVAAADMFRWWVLVDKTVPLPVEWLSLSAICNLGDVTINWSTATEQNADYFTVERSFDGTTFSAIATKPAAGNTSAVQNYSAVDTDPYSGTSYYRVKETDFNGAYIYSGTIPVSGCPGDDVVIYGEDGGASININAMEDGQYNIEMFDMLGQKITGQIANVTAGNNHIKLSAGAIASAIYIVKVFNNNNSIAKKVFIRSEYK